MAVTRKNQWSKNEIIQALEGNVLFQMTYFAKHTPTLQFVSQPDVTIVMSKVPDDMFNYVVAARFSPANASERIASISRLFESEGLPFSWWVSERDTPADLEKFLVKQGLSYKEQNICMYLDLDEFQVETEEPPLSCVKVETVSQLIDFSRIIVKIGGHRELFEKIYSKVPPSLYQKENNFEMYVGYFQDEPVATGIMVLHHDVAGIYYVTTVPSQRNKGFGTAMMKSLLSQAKKRGYHMATLQSSQAGKGLYERLGFQSCGIVKEYAKGHPSIVD